jgi:NAD(P)-dependent dehydrogenase (short-subunit alcohol dehydrogenase family)
MLARAPGELISAPFAASISQLCATLGGRVLDLELDFAAQDALPPSIGNEKIDLLVLDGAGLFAAVAAESPDGPQALRACMDGAWNVTQSLVNYVFLKAGAGRIVYLAPTGEQGRYAGAARAGLENLARTLSIEWARHAITAVAITPGSASTDEVATLIAYIASPAGAYFSGCLLELGSCS